MKEIEDPLQNDFGTVYQNVGLKHFSDSSKEIHTNLKYENTKILALRAFSFLFVAFLA